ncbi:Reverse transcriptase zinc-binding domain [Sesbania bispinosa]|nr:Reverse transcriptase zinc-binding domain [Sesbania bispinosa]
MDKRIESAGSSSAPPFPWTKILSANCIPRCKEFAWRACHDIIPVLTGLQRKKIQLDPICPLCGEEPETTEHAILYCSQVAPLWFASQLGIAIDRERFGNGHKEYSCQASKGIPTGCAAAEDILGNENNNATLVYKGGV